MSMTDDRAGPAVATKKVFVKTYGCQMNVYDSQRMSDALAADGYAATDAIEDADLVLLNTCHIREKAAEKVYSELGRIRQLKERRAADGRSTVIGVTGCVAQAEGQSDIPPFFLGDHATDVLYLFSQGQAQEPP